LNIGEQNPPYTDKLFCKDLLKSLVFWCVGEGTEITLRDFGLHLDGWRRRDGLKQWVEDCGSGQWSGISPSWWRWGTGMILM